MTAKQTAAVTEAATETFEIGAYYGILLSQAKAQLDIINEIIKAVGADKDPSWIDFYYSASRGSLLDAISEFDMSLKHVRVVAVQREHEEDFLELQISKEAMEAYTEYCAELASVSGVIFGMLKSIMQVIALSGIGKAANKLNEVFLARKKD